MLPGVGECLCGVGEYGADEGDGCGGLEVDGHAVIRYAVGRGGANLTGLLGAVYSICCLVVAAYVRADRGYPLRSFSPTIPGRLRGLFPYAAILRLRGTASRFRESLDLPFGSLEINGGSTNLIKEGERGECCLGIELVLVILLP